LVSGLDNQFYRRGPVKILTGREEILSQKGKNRARFSKRRLKGNTYPVPIQKEFPPGWALIIHADDGPNQAQNSGLGRERVTAVRNGGIGHAKVSDGSP